MKELYAIGAWTVYLTTLIVASFAIGTSEFFQQEHEELINVAGALTIFYGIAGFALQIIGKVVTDSEEGADKFTEEEQLMFNRIRFFLTIPPLTATAIVVSVLVLCLFGIRELFRSAKDVHRIASKEL